MIDVTSIGQTGVLCQWRNNEFSGAIGSYLTTTTGEQTVDYPNDNLNPSTQYYFALVDNATSQDIVVQQFITPSARNLSRMLKSELQSMADEQGIEYTAKDTKSNLIAKLEA